MSVLIIYKNSCLFEICSAASLSPLTCYKRAKNDESQRKTPQKTSDI